METLAGKAIIEIVVVIAAIWVFLKFCAFSRRFSLPGKVKTFIYILTGLGTVFFNYLYSKAKVGMGLETALKDEKTMITALVISLAMVFLFSFALMSETKA